MMENINVKYSIPCPYCKYFINFINSDESEIISYTCNCGSMSIDVYSKNTYSMYLDISSNYQIVINHNIFNIPITFLFLKYSSKSSRKTDRDADNLLSLNYIPSLDFKNADNLLNQLLLLINFK